MACGCVSFDLMQTITAQAQRAIMGLTRGVTYVIYAAALRIRKNMAV